MANVFRSNRKGSDRDIVRYNSLGFSLATIGLKLGCHPTSVTLRLKGLKIRPADTRRAFMEEIYDKLPESYQTILADLLEDRSITSIKDYVRELIDADIKSRLHNQPDPAHV